MVRFGDLDRLPRWTHHPTAARLCASGHDVAAGHRGSAAVTSHEGAYSMIRSSRIAAVIAGCLLLLSVVAAPVAAKPPSWSHHDAHVCGQPGEGQASCTAIARTFYKDGHAYHAGSP